jgi:2-oxoglutarate ferredoxin oxidoreductase subunit gamma
VIAADLLLTLSQEACDKYYHDLKRDGILIVDSVHVLRVPTSKAFSLPISRLAEERTGRAITANMVGLGVLAGLTDVISEGALRKAIAERAPEGTEEINLEALTAGLEEVKKLR